MIDTVSYFYPYQLKPGGLPVGWEVTRQSGWRRGGTYSRQSFVHKKTKLRASFELGKPTSIEVSLPRLVYPNNARLLVTQQELDDALAKADKLVCEIAKPVQTSVRGRRRFSRVDLVWQVQGNIVSFIEAHRHLPHPALQRGGRSVVYYRETILWGKLRNNGCRLSIYDKLAQMKRGRGDVVRIELQLRGSKLREFLGRRVRIGSATSSGAPVNELKIEWCYRALRDVLLRLQPKAAVRISTQHDILYWAAKTNWQIMGRPATDIILEGYTSDKRRKEAVKQLQSHCLRAYKIDWRKLLPHRMPQVFLLKHGCTVGALCGH